MNRNGQRNRSAAILSLGFTLTAWAGCTTPETPPPAWQQATTPAQRAAAQGLDGRDQYALLDAIVTAKGNALVADPSALARVRSEWIDHRYRWEARLQPALCGLVGDCVVLPFDHQSRPDPIQQGWLPRLDLDPAHRTALHQRCAGHTQCVVSFEATLSQFELSTELPTSLTFSDVQVHSVRQARSDEAWTVSRRRARLTERVAAAMATHAEPK